MSTHNIEVYEEISKIIPLFSSNIKYASYLFFCSTVKVSIELLSQPVTIMICPRLLKSTLNPIKQSFIYNVLFVCLI